MPKRKKKKSSTFRWIGVTTVVTKDQIEGASVSARTRAGKKKEQDRGKNLGTLFTVRRELKKGMKKIWVRSLSHLEG